MNKKTALFIVLGMLVLVVVPSHFALAQLHDYSSGTVTKETLVYYIENLVAYVFSAIAVICFVVAGIFFLTAQGNPEKIGAAKSMVIWGVVGVVVGIIAFSIIALVASFLVPATATTGYVLQEDHVLVLVHTNPKTIFLN